NGLERRLQRCVRLGHTEESLFGYAQPGPEDTGQIAFLIPSSETPAELEYNVPDSIEEFVTNLPTPSSAVSEPNPEIIANMKYTTDVTGFEVLEAFPSIQNNSLYFYSGQTIAIEVALTDVVPGTTATVDSIASGTAGLIISQISPSLPATINGNSNGGEVDVMVYIFAPPTSFTCTITLNMTGSES